MRAVRVLKFESRTHHQVEWAMMPQTTWRRGEVVVFPVLTRSATLLDD